MNPDILLADEVLAVGDIDFQERCLERVKQAGRDGMSVLFVSHDMAAISRLCTRVLWLNAGEIVKLGELTAILALVLLALPLLMLQWGFAGADIRVRVVNISGGGLPSTALAGQSPAPAIRRDAYPAARVQLTRQGGIGCQNLSVTAAAMQVNEQWNFRPLRIEVGRHPQNRCQRNVVNG